MTLSVQYICLITEDEHETFDCLCAEDRVTQQRKQLGGEERRRGEGREGGGGGEVYRLYKLVNYATHTP